MRGNRDAQLRRVWKAAPGVNEELATKIEAIPARHMAVIRYVRPNPPRRGVTSHYSAELDPERTYVSTPLYHRSARTGDEAAELVKAALLEDLRRERTWKERRFDTHQLEYIDMPRWLANGDVNPTDDALLTAAYPELADDYVEPDCLRGEGGPGRALLRSEKPNGEGLTFQEWLSAADPAEGEYLMYAPKMEYLRRQYPAYVKAWLAGEDPTEWRAHLENQRAEEHEQIRRDMR